MVSDYCHIFYTAVWIGLIGTISDFKTLQLYEDFANNKAQYYNVIGNSIIPIIYGALAVIAIILSKLFSAKTQRSSILK